MWKLKLEKISLEVNMNTFKLTADSLRRAPLDTSFKTKLLLHLRQQQSEAGFTFLEICIVLLIIMILSSIMYPILVSKLMKARQAEARLMLTAACNAQAEQVLATGNFAPDVGQLPVIIPRQSQFFTYGGYYSGPSTFDISSPYPQTAAFYATPINNLTDRTLGCITYISQDIYYRPATRTLICESTYPQGIPNFPPPPAYFDDPLYCQ
jgi:type II secretory pathway pseudopilin PulG